MVPTDVYMLFSWCNTMLRDEYDSLEALCAAFELSQEDLTARLAEIGYRYEEKTNRFVPILR